MSFTPAINTTVLQQWIAEKLDAEKVNEKLRSLGYDEETVEANLKEFKKLCYAKRQFAGFIFLGIGAFVGFLSCVTSLINPVPELFNWFLYGLTSVALVLIFRGLYCILN